MDSQTAPSRLRTLCPSFLENLQNSPPKKEQFLDSEGNPISAGNYLSPKGHCYRVHQVSPGTFRFLYSGNFDQGYQNLTPELASTLGVFEGDFSEKIMQLFDLLESQADSRKRPIYECVSPSNGTWANRYKNAKVTPSIPDPGRDTSFPRFSQEFEQTLDRIHQRTGEPKKDILSRVLKLESYTPSSSSRTMGQEVDGPIANTTYPFVG
jgi:hypothetical protein